MNDQAQIPMGNCVGCGNPWFMSHGEKSFYDKKIAEQGFQMPRRCRDCRKKRETQGRISIPILIKAIDSLTKKVLNEEYSFRSADLAQELTDISGSLSAFIQQNPRDFKKEHNETTEAEGEQS